MSREKNEDSSNKEIFYYDAKRGGVFCDFYKIAPYPGFVHRRTAILDCIQMAFKNLPKTKNVAEIGFGAGLFSYEAYLLGANCTGFDSSPSAVEIANDIFNKNEKRIDFRNLEDLNNGSMEQYDCLMVFEVLEHVEDDNAILKKWRKLIKSDGYLLLSVPAKMKLFSYSDLRAGHIRRYEKKELIAILTSNGFKVQSCISWGFPVIRLLNFLKNIFIDKPVCKELKELDQEKMTEISGGFNRNKEYKFKKFLPFRLIYIFANIQRIFYKFDWGLGYVIIATTDEKET